MGHVGHVQLVGDPEQTQDMTHAGEIMFLDWIGKCFTVSSKELDVVTKQKVWASML